VAFDFVIEYRSYQLMKKMNISILHHLPTLIIRPGVSSSSNLLGHLYMKELLQVLILEGYATLIIIYC